jgi:hypothetical protein
MSNEAVDRQQQKVTEFLRLMPLTLDLAGLPRADHGRHYNEGQLEIRANAIRLAYKFARQILVDIAKDSKEAKEAAQAQA